MILVPEELGGPMAASPELLMMDAGPWNVDNVMRGVSCFRSQGCWSHCTMASTEPITLCRCNQHSLGAIVRRRFTNYAVAVVS